MKVFLFAFSCVAAVIRSAESSNETNEKRKHDKDLFVLTDEHANKQERALDAESRSDTNGCDCAKEDILAIHEAHQDILEHVPLSMLGLLDANRDSIWGPGGWDPTEDYKKASAKIKELVMHATKCLKEIVCGTCDYDWSSSRAEQVAGDISLFECCCDAGYIRQVTISYLKALKEVATLNPGGSSFTCIALDYILRTAKHTIDELARRHKPITSGECTADMRDELGFPEAGDIVCTPSPNPFCNGPIPIFGLGTYWVTLADGSGSACVEDNFCSVVTLCPNGQSDCSEGFICSRGNCNGACLAIPGYFLVRPVRAVETEGLSAVGI